MSDCRCCWYDGKAIQSSGIHNPTWSFFLSLSLSFSTYAPISFYLSVSPVSLSLCIQSTLLHDFIKRITILSIFSLSSLFLSFFFHLFPISEWLAFELFIRYSQTTFLCRSNRQQHHEKVINQLRWNLTAVNSKFHFKCVPVYIVILVRMSM